MSKRNPPIGKAARNERRKLRATTVTLAYVFHQAARAELATIED